MKDQISQTNLSDWIKNLESKGKQTFSLGTIQSEIRNQTATAIKRSLNRLSRKGKIVSIYKGFYAIIPPQYSMWGILPPTLFIDDLMRYLGRPYYVGLLSAAAFHGASHQSPQEVFVITNYPAIRPTKKKDIKINYVSKGEINEYLLEERKTEAGFLKISSPELTAVDLIRYEKRVGGLNRVAMVLGELAEAIKLEKITKEFVEQMPLTVVQRLGYLLESVLHAAKIADRLYERLLKLNAEFYPTPLK
jgi:predicted transcriptional regulator of viral defense system